MPEEPLQPPTQDPILEEKIPQTRHIFPFPMVLFILIVSAVIFGGGGYFLGTKIGQSQSTNTLKTPKLDVSPTPIVNEKPSSIQEKTSQSIPLGPLDAAKTYLDAYVAKDWKTVKELCGDPDFNEQIAET